MYRVVHVVDNVGVRNHLSGKRLHDTAALRTAKLPFCVSLISSLTWCEVKYVPLLQVASSKRRFLASSVGACRMLAIRPATPPSVLIWAERKEFVFVIDTVVVATV